MTTNKNETLLEILQTVKEIHGAMVLKNIKPNIVTRTYPAEFDSLEYVLNALLHRIEEWQAIEEDIEPIEFIADEIVPALQCALKLAPQQDVRHFVISYIEGIIECIDDGVSAKDVRNVLESLIVRIENQSSNESEYKQKLRTIKETLNSELGGTFKLTDLTDAVKRLAGAYNGQLEIQPDIRRVCQNIVAFHDQYFNGLPFKQYQRFDRSVDVDCTLLNDSYLIATKLLKKL